jgi:hypothetical protein
LDHEDVLHDILQIQSLFAEDYESVTREEGSFVKIYNLGAHYEINGITGYLPCKCLCFLMNLNVLQKPIYLSRHGESTFNIEDRVGGDCDISSKGLQYARLLESFFKAELQNEDTSKIQVLTSTLKRAVITAEHIGLPVMQIKHLDEISVGVCDGMTYKEIEERYPFEN